MSEILQIQAKDAVVRINHFDVINGVQNFNWDPNLNEEYIEELGNAAHADMKITPEISGSFDVTSSGATASILGRMIYTLDDVSGDFEGPLGPDNDHLIRETDFARAVFDFTESKKANEIFDRSTLLPRVTLSSFSLAATADGNASETYNFDGDRVDVYRKSRHDIIAIPVTRVDSETVEVPAGYNVSSDWNIEYLMIGSDIVKADALTASGQEIEVSGKEVRQGARLSLVLSRKVPGAFPTISYPTSARFIGGDQIDIWMVPKATLDIEAQLALGTDLNTINFSDADSFLRAQSMDIDVDMGLEALRQIKMNDFGTTVYSRQPTYPLSITSSLTSYETDLKDWAKIQGKGDADVLNLADFAGREFQLVRRDYIKGVPVQTVALLDAKVNGRGSQIGVGARAEVSWSFVGSKIAIQGVEGV